MNSRSVETRAQFIERRDKSLKWYLTLTDGEEAAWKVFSDPDLETYDFMISIGSPCWGFSPDPDSGGNFLNEHRPEVIAQVPEALRIKWQRWNQTYLEVLERNPRLELHRMLHWIGETHDFSSWPYGLEDRIKAWVDKGEFQPMPFDDRREIITPEFYRRLQVLRQRCGGWFYYSEAKGTTFVPAKASNG
jgi:hypothetical protein